MKYLDAINKNIINFLNKNKFFIYGQNINTGTFISGLTKNINKIKKNTVKNVPNCENSLVGLGFGVMLDGGNSIYVAKQLDFLLLGIDHFVNTMNFIKVKRKKLGSFNIITFVCDQGFQGPQSSFNNIDDLSSLAQVNTFQVNTLFEANKIFSGKRLLKGFNIIAISQRLSNKEIFALDADSFAKNYSAFVYYESKYSDYTIISSNFSFEYACQLRSKNKMKNIQILNFNYLNEIDSNFILKKIKNSKKVVLITDTKSINSRNYIIYKLIKENLNKRIIFLKKDNYCWNNQKDDMVIKQKL
jgi:pyruvate/2-oxoglutarate/acetoin dehydrogenase E1 component